jgi:hypothetical protein
MSTSQEQVHKRHGTSVGEPEHMCTDCADGGVAVLLRILELIHAGLIDNTVMTKR